MHPMPFEDAIFEEDDCVRLAGPLASLAWFGVALVNLLIPGGHCVLWIVHPGALAVAFALVGIVLAAWSVLAARQPSSSHAQKIFPWFVILAVSVELLELATTSPKALWDLQ